MAQVSVTINGRVYRMACEDGQEAHLEGLAANLDATINRLREGFGEIGDQRLTVMAAIMAMDESSEVQRRISGLEAELRALRAEHSATADRHSRIEQDLARHLEEAARRIETLAASIVTGKPGN